MKTLHVTASTGSPIELCPKCHEVKGEIAAFFKVPLSPGNAVIDVHFRPMYYCQCDKVGQEQPAPMSDLTLGSMVHYVGSTGRHEPSAVTEIFDAVAGRVKLRNLYTLTTDTCIYSETPIPDSWHWIERTQNETQEEKENTASAD